MNIYSLVIPVYNRPEEIDELLGSLLNSHFKNFEVIIVEDGSQRKCEQIIEKYQHKLDIKYTYQDNTGPGPARNNGAKSATGEYIIFLDSDVIVPENYLEIINKDLSKNSTDCFGGPDKDHPSFTKTQKAINYSMTSTLTTGGIRGSQENFDKFYPRSFNLGIKKSVFEEMNGFSEMRFGEDLDLSMRIIEKGFQTKLIRDAFVYHKRRNNYRSFFKQVFNSGIARINLELKHPKTLKLVHTLPSVFVIYLAITLIISIFWWPVTALLLLPAILFFIDALARTRELVTSALGVIAVYTQLIGYGSGFIKAFVLRIVLKKKEFHNFEQTFYK